MKTILIGNDISFRWDVREKGGSPFDLEGKEVALYRKGFSGNVRIGEVSVKGNVVSWSWPGREQTSPGTYSFLLVVNEGGDGMHSLDTGPAVTLVSSPGERCRVGFPDREDLGGILGDYLIAVEKAGKAAALAEESALKADKAADKAMGVVQESAESLKDKLDIHNYFEIMGSSAMRPVYEACGGVWNEETGYYELNGLLDITEEQMLWIYIETFGWWTEYGPVCRYSRHARTNLRPQSYGIRFISSEVTYPFGESVFETINLMALWSSDPERYEITVNNNIRIFYNCPGLREITGKIRLIQGASPRAFYVANRCPLLKEIRVEIYNDTDNISFCEDSPLLSYESVKYLIDNAANTEAVIVTISPATYSYLSGSAQPSAEVGGTTEEWQALMTTAAGKQISFATEE